MKYIALLRGINVGGKGIVKMSALKAAVEKLGYRNVATFIQSGNVILDSDGRDAGRIGYTLETGLENLLGFQTRAVVVSYAQLNKVVSAVPLTWKKQGVLRQYIAFIRKPLRPKDVIRELEPRNGIDFVDPGPGVVYMSTMLRGITKSGLSKISKKSIYKELTIRNFNTVRKLLELMSIKSHSV